MTDEHDQLEQIARSLANIEAMYGEVLRKQDEDRAEGKERQKKLDEETIRFTDTGALNEQFKSFQTTEWMKQFGYLLLMVSLLILTIVAASKR